MELTKRDLLIIDFITKFPCTSDLIKFLFFTGKQTCNDRLTKLYKGKKIKRVRNSVVEPYVYYITKKPKQLKHCAYLSKTYIWIINQGYEILDFEREKNYENIRPDVLYHIKDDESEGYIFVEVELSNNNVSKKLDKYMIFNVEYRHKYFNTPPKLIYFTNSNIKYPELDVIFIKLSELA